MRTDTALTRHALRKQMYELDRDIANHNDDVRDPNSDTLTKLLVRADALSEKIATPAEQAYSANTFLNLTRAASDKVTRFCRKTTAAAPADLVRRIRSKCGTEVLSSLQDDARIPLTAINWTAIGQTAAQLYRSAPCACIDFMLGAVKPPRMRTKRELAPKKRKPAPVGPSQAPEQMDTEKQDDSNETSKLTEAMFETVLRHNGRPYAHFVLDPRSFAQTVENMFSIAMLVGNAKVALLPDEEWGMLVHLPGGHGSGQGPAVAPSPAQMVLNMNFSTWRSMCEVVKPDDLLTVHRADIRLANSSQANAGSQAGSSKRLRTQ